MVKGLVKRALAVLWVMALCAAIVPPPSAKAATVTQNQKNMVERADYCYNLTWVAQQTVAGWGGTFYQGSTYHIPYGQPIYSGKYIGYGATYEEFIAAASTAGSIFYTGRSWYDGPTAPYYVTDCSSFVSWVWGINRTTTYYIPNYSTNLGSVTTSRATHTLQLGDALNSAAHVVLVSGLDYDASGAITRIEITEQTPPQMKRSYYSPSQLYGKYSNYTIQRYYGDVPAAPAADEEPPVISNLTYSEVSASGYTISCTVTDNVGVSKVTFPTWTANKGQDDLPANWMNTQLGTKNGNTYTFRVNASDHNNETGFYATHIYAEDRKGNVAKLQPPAVEVRNDTENPVISDVVYSNVSSAGYTISCRVTDDWGLSNVCFPTWTVANNQDDLIANWPVTQRGTQNGDIYTFRVNASDHNNEGGMYATHIYASDCAGHTISLALGAVEVRNDTQAPEIYDAKISEVTANGYKVTCKVKDDWGLNSVAFPTWTIAGGQDDLPEQFMETQKGQNVDGTYTFYVKSSDHNNEKGFYITHIYARDCAGNTSSVELEEVELKDPTAKPEKIVLRSSSAYSEDGDYVTQVSSGTTVEELLAEFENNGLKVTGSNGIAISGTAPVGTGATISLYNGATLVDRITVVITGDVDGDGSVDSTDYLRIKSAFLGTFMLDDAQELAADVDSSSSVDNTDYMKVKYHFLRSYSIG